jgi:hypothetical protein
MVFQMSAPTCKQGHAAQEMSDLGAILHGQSRKFECPTCKRLILCSNVPHEDSPEVRVLRSPS